MFQKPPPEVFYKKSDFKNFTKFTEKHQILALFFKKLQVLGLQRKTPAQLFSIDFWEVFKNTFCIKHHWVAASEYLSSNNYAFLLV